MSGLDVGERKGIEGFGEERNGYQIRYASSEADRVAVQRLRFDVFARELGATVVGAEQGLDADPIDAIVDHLLVIEQATGECVGTYRLATWEQVGHSPGFYTGRIFDLAALDPRIPQEGVELGRACVSLRHRERGVFQLLLRGIGAYLTLSHKRFLFGCGSILLKDADETGHVMREVERTGWIDPSLAVEPTAAYRLPHPPSRAGIGPELPPLLQAYCAFGARLAPSPAWDPDFRSLDYFVLLDGERLEPRTRARFCGGAR